MRVVFSFPAWGACPRLLGPYTSGIREPAVCTSSPKPPFQERRRRKKRLRSSSSMRHSYHDKNYCQVNNYCLNESRALKWHGQAAWKHHGERTVFSIVLCPSFFCYLYEGVYDESLWLIWLVLYAVKGRPGLIRFLDDHYTLAASSTLPGYAQGERPIPARAERSCDSSGVEACGKWIDIIWNPYYATVR